MQSPALPTSLGLLLMAMWFLMWNHSCPSCPAEPGLCCDTASPPLRDQRSLLQCTLIPKPEGRGDHRDAICISEQHIRLCPPPPAASTPPALPQEASPLPLVARGQQGTGDRRAAPASGTRVGGPREPQGWQNGAGGAVSGRSRPCSNDNQVSGWR